MKPEPYVFISDDRPPSYDNFTLDLVQAGLSGVVHSTGTMRPVGTDPSAATPPRSTAEGRRAWWFHNRTAWKRVSTTDRDDLISAMVKHRVWYEPTRLVDYYWFHQDRYDTTAMPARHPWRTRPRSAMMADPAIRTAVLEAEAAEADFITRFHRSGGMVLAGTDDVPFPPFGVTEEMQLLVDAGLSRLAALQAATLNAARAIKLDDRIGTLERGKLADVLVLDASPLESILNIRRIHAVVANGQFLDRSALDAMTPSGLRR